MFPSSFAASAESGLCQFSYSVLICLSAMLVALEFALVILIFSSLKKQSFASSNSICYSFTGEEAKDICNARIISSLWTYKQEKGITIRRNSHSGLNILLILAGDVELCPGPALKCFICSKTVRRNQRSDACSECNRLCHVKYLVDTDMSGCKVLFCSTCALSTQSTTEPCINGDSIYERLKEFAKMRGLKIIHQNINGLIRKLGMVDILLKETDRAIDIFAITETHLSRDIKDGELNLDNYTFVRKDHETGIGGGVGCFI